MSSDPYPPVDSPRATRVSGLAVSSLVFSLVCCIPGSGMVGTVLGGAGLIRIGQSEGRLGGRTLAFVGVVLGILSTVFWLALGVGCRQAIATFQGRLARPVSEALTALEGDDLATGRAVLDPTVSRDLPDADLRAFVASVKDKFGAPVTGPSTPSLSQLFSNQPSITLPPGPHTVLPWPIAFDKGTVWVFIVSDSPTTATDILLHGGSVQGRVSNLGVVGPQGQAWLIDPTRKPPKAAGSAGR